MKNVLWLASWYPNRLDKFDGDFIQRHARAVAMFCKVHVIYVKKDEGLAANKNTTENAVSGNLSEQIIYYGSYKTGIKLFDKFLSQRNYRKHYRNAVKDYIRTSGKPDMVHVHVAMKAGMAAGWIKEKWDIPYVVSEHWTAYLRNADHQIADQSFIFKKVLNRVLQRASAITVVSDHLGKAIQWYLPEIKYHVIPNVVDTDVFYPAAKQDSQLVRFIHVSNMNYQKNTEAILAALHILKEREPFEMYLYGPANSGLQKLITGYEMDACVFIMGEQPQTEIAKAIQQSDALILYSRFETFGCVIIEANACGIPVIISDLEVFHELVEEGVNGIFVEGENPGALAEKMKQFISSKDKFDNTAIAKVAAEKYNYSKIGGQFNDLYEKIVTTE